jgi:hypothetical protein
MKTSAIFRRLGILILVLILSSCQKKNHPPAIADQVFSIEENSETGTAVGQVTATDEESIVLYYKILRGNTADAFSISALDGKIIVNNEAAIDYETTPKFTLGIEVSDGRKRSEAEITINLTDLQITTAGLVLYLPFDGNVNDLSSSGNNGTDYTSHYYAAGKRSQALDFNGTSDYIQLKKTVNSQYGLSFSFWVKTRGPNGAENNGSIISKYSKINNTRCFMVYSFGSYTTRNDNRLSAAFYEYGFSSGEHDMTKSYLEAGELMVYPNPALWTITNPTRLVVGEWTHCIVNLTPTSVETWINGKFCTKKSREYTTYYNSDSEPVMIGNNYDIGEGINNHFNGVLDELRIYNRGLTVKEIKTLFKE